MTNVHTAQHIPERKLSGRSVGVEDYVSVVCTNRKTISFRNYRKETHICEVN
jgi:hypothetical protein